MGLSKLWDKFYLLLTEHDSNFEASYPSEAFAHNTVR